MGLKIVDIDLLLQMNAIIAMNHLEVKSETVG